MTIFKHHKYENPTYKRIHSYLWRRLAREAFDHYYQCARCGAHARLEIHIPNCDPALLNEPGFYEILCTSCHKKLKRPR